MHVLALRCDFGVDADMSGMSSFLNIVHVSISESQLPANMRYCLVQHIEREKKNKTREPVNQRITTRK